MLEALGGKAGGRFRHFVEEGGAMRRGGGGKLVLVFLAFSRGERNGMTLHHPTAGLFFVGPGSFHFSFPVAPASSSPRFEVSSVR